MKILGVAVVVLAIVVMKANAQKHLGCYLSIKALSDKGSYIWQTPDSCKSLCSLYDYYALKNGGECYCMNSKPSGGKSSSCDTHCNGYKYISCGGKEAYDVYAMNNDESEDSNSLSSSESLSTSSESSSLIASKTSSHSFTSAGSGLTSSSSTPTSSSSSSSSSPSSTSASSKSSSSSQSPSSSMASSSVSKQATYSAVTESGKTSAEPVTVTSISQPLSTLSAGNKNSNSEKSQKKSGKNVGAIAGGTVGGVVGVVIISLIAFFFIRHRKHDSDSDEESFAEKPDLSTRGGSNKSKINQLSLFARPMSNPFADPPDGAGGTDSALAPPLASLRRYSDGTLAEDDDVSRHGLHVANPDS